ncbi:MAG TPA: metallophosphoesterase [Candidatus Nitrosotenuis sp.]|nr:metallophosphoesterase [Candidatus Nitrosotenuis sp.]
MIEGDDISDFLDPEYLKQYASVFSNPEEVTSAYTDQLVAEAKSEFMDNLTTDATKYGTGLLAVHLAYCFGRRGIEQAPRSLRYRVAQGGLGLTLVAGATAASTAHAWQDFKEWGTNEPTAVNELPIEALDDTPLEGTTTDTPILKAAADDLKPTIDKHLKRLEEASEEKTNQFAASARAQKHLLVTPQKDERAFLLVSDLHCNRVMIDVWTELGKIYNEKASEGRGEEIDALAAEVGKIMNERAEKDISQENIALDAVISAGDNSNGHDFEKPCINAIGQMGNGAPVVTASSNHDSPRTEEMMEDAGIKVVVDEMITLEDETGATDGTTIYSKRDPQQSSPMGKNSFPHGSSEEESGQQAYEEAQRLRPDIVILHQPKALAGFLGVKSFKEFTEDAQNNDNTTDALRNLPAHVALTGHWHVDKEPVIVKNDGTNDWPSQTALLQLDTAGGAFTENKINDFSFFNAPPQQDASVTILILGKNNEVKYQKIHADADLGTLTIMEQASVTTSDGVLVNPEQNNPAIE